jgi:hypothetical protein
VQPAPFPEREGGGFFISGNAIVNRSQGHMVDLCLRTRQNKPMNGGGSIFTGIAARRFASWLLLVALLLRGLIPAGFMPDLNSTNGQGWLVICTSAGERSVKLDDGTGNQHGPVDQHQQGLCPFAALIGFTPILFLAALLLPLLPRSMIQPLAASVPLPRLLACAPPGARAPPLAV